jgi:hypothetical protein
MTEEIPADEVPEQVAAPPAGTVTAAVVGVGNADDGGGCLPDGDDCELPECPVPGRDPETDLRVSVHEAFHALAMRLCNCPVGTVTIQPGDTYEGMVSGPEYTATRAKGDVIADAQAICDVLRPSMPQPGEDRGGVSDVFQSLLDQCIITMAGEVGERMLLPDEPQPALSDRRQAATLAGLICQSPRAVEQLIALAETMANDLLRPYGYIGIVLSTALRIRRSMTGVEVDEVIASTLASWSQAGERARRAAWQRTVENAASFATSLAH